MSIYLVQFYLSKFFIQVKLVLLLLNISIYLKPYLMSILFKKYFNYIFSPVLLVIAT